MASMLIVKSAYCPDFDEWAKKQSVRHSYTETPQPGDLVLYDFSGKHTSRDHIGIVKEAGASTFYAYEGNTGTGNEANGGAVMLRQRYYSQVVCFIRPKYDGTQTAKRLLEIAASQVGIKESPANSNNVKYNTWFYGRAVSGSAYAWCGAFVSWCFAVLAGQITDLGGTGTTVKKTACTVTGYVLKKGSTGVGVVTLQAALNAHGYNCGQADGKFGTQTEIALKAFQTANGLTADGECGALTWAKLLAV